MLDHLFGRKVIELLAMKCPQQAGHTCDLNYCRCCRLLSNIVEKHFVLGKITFADNLITSNIVSVWEEFE